MSSASSLLAIQPVSLLLPHINDFAVMFSSFFYLNFQGHICYYIETPTADEKVVFTGDTLFQGK
jgi:hypothetical protein